MPPSTSLPEATPHPSTAPRMILSFSSRAWSRNPLMIFIATTLFPLSLVSAQDQVARLTFACPYSWESCCDTWAGIAVIAARHVNARNDSIVPEIATLKNVTVDLSTQDRNAYASGYALVKASQEATSPPHGYIAYYYSSDTISSHKYFAEKNLDTPLVGWGAASPVFLKFPTYYQNFYSVYPNDALVAQQMARVFVNEFGWKFFACIHEPDSWSTGFIDVFQETYNSLVPASANSTAGSLTRYQVTPGLQHEYDTTVRAMEAGVARVAVYINLSPSSMARMLATAAARGMAGKSAVQPWSWAGVSLGAAGASFEPNYYGLVSVMPKDKVQTKLTYLRDIWFSEMGTGPLPTASALGLTTGGGATDMEVANRRVLSASCEAYGVYVYDAVVAAALGFEKYANGTFPTFASALADGVEMNGMTGTLKQQKGDNIRNWGIRSSGLTYALLNIQDQMQEITRFQQASQVTSAHVAQLRSPGQKTTLPLAYEAGPCFFDQIECNFGKCMDVPKLGFEEGYCACNPGFLGQKCNVKETRAMTFGPSSSGQISALANVFWYKFDKFDETQFTAYFTVTQMYKDDRVRVTNGVYHDAVLDQLEADLLIWLPKVTVEDCAKLEAVGKRLAEVRYPIVYYEYQVRAVDCPVTPFWDYYPYDRQALSAKFENANTDLFWEYDFEVWRSGSHLVPPWRGYQPALATDAERAAALLFEQRYAPGEKHPGIPNNEVYSMNWNPTWPIHSAYVRRDHQSVNLVTEVERDASLWMYRVALPATLLGTFAFSTFTVGPHNLMPRFMSGFLAYIALQNFRANAVEEAPTTMTEISYFEALLLYLTVMNASCVIAVMVGELLMQKYGPLVVNDLDRVSRRTVPQCYFIAVVSAQLCAGEDNWLGVGVYGFLGLQMALAALPPLIWMLWCYVLVANSDHFFLYNSLHVAVSDPAAPCELRDHELTLLYKWIARKYGYASEADRRERLEQTSAERHTAHKVESNQHEEDDEANEQLLLIEDVAKYVVETIKGDLDLERCIFYTKVIFDVCDESGDGMLNVKEWKDNFPKCVEATARGGGALAKRSRWFLAALYFKRTFRGYKAPQYINKSKSDKEGMNANNYSSLDLELMLSDANRKNAFEHVLPGGKALQHRKSAAVFVAMHKDDGAEVDILQLCRDQLLDRHGKRLSRHDVPLPSPEALKNIKPDDEEDVQEQAQERGGGERAEADRAEGINATATTSMSPDSVVVDVSQDDLAAVAKTAQRPPRPDPEDEDEVVISTQQAEVDQQAVVGDTSSGLKNRNGNLLAQKVEGEGAPSVPLLLDDDDGGASNRSFAAASGAASPRFEVSDAEEVKSVGFGG